MVDSPKSAPLSLRQELRFKQRFNVAASRARDQMWLVYSLDPTTDLRKGDVRRNLIEHALNPGALSKQIETEQGKAQSEFERDVLRRLMTAGYKAVAQYAIGTYRIDIIVQGVGGKRLAVECDGEQYHTLLDLEHDLDRQRLLERAGGLTFHRIRGASYYRDPDAAVQRLEEHLRQLDIEPILQAPEPESSVEHELRTRVLRRANELRADVAEGRDYYYYRGETKQEPNLDTSKILSRTTQLDEGDSRRKERHRPSGDRSAYTPGQGSAGADSWKTPEQLMRIHRSGNSKGNGSANIRPSIPTRDSNLKTARPSPLYEQSGFFEPTQENLRPDREPLPSAVSKPGERVRMEPINETLHLRKETKGTFVFESDDPNAAITTLYVRKDVFANRAAPAKISLTVEEP
jgi:very-short-patch-repair endonuclease